MPRSGYQFTGQSVTTGSSPCSGPSTTNVNPTHWSLWPLTDTAPRSRLLLLNASFLSSANVMVSRAFLVAERAVSFVGRALVGPADFADRPGPVAGFFFPMVAGFLHVQTESGHEIVRRTEVATAGLVLIEVTLDVAMLAQGQRSDYRDRYRTPLPQAPDGLDVPPESIGIDPGL